MVLNWKLEHCHPYFIIHLQSSIAHCDFNLLSSGVTYFCSWLRSHSNFRSKGNSECSGDWVVHNQVYNWMCTHHQKSCLHLASMSWERRWFLTYGCSISSSFSSGILHDLMLGLGLSLQYHFSGSLSGTVPSGNLRHLRQSGLSHCTHIWSGSSLKMKIQWNLPKCPLNRGCLLKLPYITNFNL